MKPERRIHIKNPYEDNFIVVHFVGDHTFNKYKELGRHTNPGYEICLVQHGKGVFNIQDSVYPVGPGQIFITRESQAHSGLPSDENPYRLLYICFQIKTTATEPGSIWNMIFSQLEDINFPVTDDMYELEDIHHRLISEVQETSLFSTELTASLIQQFIMLTARNFERDRMKRYNKDFKNTCSYLTNRIMSQIENQIHTGISLEDISSSLNYSIPHLCKIFKEQTGFTIMEYYNFARLEKAKSFLLKTDESVSLISCKFGFGSIHHFSNAFKTMYGRSPSNFRKSYVNLPGNSYG